MKHEPSVARADVPKLAENASEAAFEAWLHALPPCPGIPSDDDEAAIAAADARARADIAAGRVWPHAIVAEWLRTWGTPDRKSFHEWLASRGG